MSEKLEIEKVPFTSKISGNRVVDIAHLLENTLAIAEAHARKCTAGNLFVEKEIRKGLNSVYEYKCNTCDKTYKCSSERANKQNINLRTVWGTFATGSTFKHTEEFLSTLNIPSLSNTLFYTIQDELSNIWSEASLENMEKAGQEEKRLAIESEQIDKDGIPWISVYLDGAWSKRSYGHNYNAASGLAVIIGIKTKKVLYLGVRNKFCIICTKAKKKDKEPYEHKCFKNWSGSSSAMEADIIVEGFSRSIEMHGLRYKQFIADGDSSVYRQIQEKVDYGNEVVKIECTNHLIKNYGKRLHSLRVDSRGVSLAARKILTTKKIKDLQSIAQKSIYDNAHGDVGNLISDLHNGIFHVFGDHTNCKDYYCGSIGEKTDEIVSASGSGLIRLIQGAMSLVLRKANSLIDNETNNRAELFMSVVARFNQGKRLNLIQRGSFNLRSDLSALRYNEGFSWHSTPFEKAVSGSPGKYFSKFMSSQSKYKEKYLKRARKYTKSTPNKKVKRKTNLDYGKNALEPEVTEEQMNLEWYRYLDSLQLSEEEQKQICADTIGQFDNPRYITERNKKLTASQFGKVIRRRYHVPCHNLVKDILYKKSFTNVHTEYGRLNESVAISLLEEKLGVKVEPSGLFIDLEHPFLGASPDGLVNEDDIVEVKCLSSISKLDITLEEAATTKNICLEFKNNKLSLKKQHYYYYQIQGQLNITRRSGCYFVVYVNQKQPLYVEKIVKDIDFWKNDMLPKLVKFYQHCIFPEIILENVKRGLKCKDPQYILDARLAKDILKKKT